MYLKRLEINGFKSFAQKTVFDFPSGIVGIVGPNGSGKSNVIDAVRWLLGEREAKNLRGGKIEDLIFSGTQKKARMSQAQVSLVFDNTGGELPIDFQEVVIGRRVSRNGASQYFINDAEVRLKDIVDFFSKIRLGTRGLTVIGQGAGDIFVRAHPQERMRMVQEILGLREYELKKYEAQRKLKHTHINLEKISAMLDEVGPRLRMLKRQTAKWHKRSQIEEELRSIEKDFFVTKLSLLYREHEHIIRPLPELAQQHKKLQEEYTHLEKELIKLEESALSKSRMQELSRERRELFEKQAQQERERMHLELEEERSKKAPHTSVSTHDALCALSNTKTTLQEILAMKSVEMMHTAIQELMNVLEKLFSPHYQKENETHRDYDKSKKEIEETLKTIHARIRGIDQEEEHISQKMERFNEEFKKIYEKLDDIRGQIKQVSDEQTKITFEEEKNVYKVQELKNYIQSLGADFHTYDAVVRAESSYTEYTSGQLVDMEKRMMRLRGEMASIGDIDEVLLKEAEEVEAHYTHLTKESDDLSKASADLFILIDELQEKIESDFQRAFKKVNEEFYVYFRLMFNGGSAKMKIAKKERSEKTKEQDEPALVEASEDKQEEEKNEIATGIDIELSIPQKKITSLDMLSGGEKSLVSIAVLFALISVSPPPFLVLDEVDSALDEKNSKRFSDLIGNFSKHTQFIIVTHNRVTMEAADILYGVTMDEGGASKVLSLKLQDAEQTIQGV